MRIGIFDPYLDTLGGGEKYILTAAQCLSQKHDISIFWNVSSAKNIKEKAKIKFNINLEKVTFFPTIFDHKTSLLKRLKISRQFDAIMYLSDGSIPLVACNLYIHFQFPVEWVSASGIKTKIKNLRIRKVFCNSLFTKKFIDKKFGINSLVLYPPADMVALKSTKKTNVILHVGRFGTTIEGKNFKKQDVMINTFKRMVKNGLKDWEFAMVVSVALQDKEKMEELKKMAKGYAITFIENPSNQALLKLYAKAKIYWHATGFGEDLIAHPEKAEHFGIATVEAMSAAAVPVVINAGGQPEIVEDAINGFLWNSTEELEEKTLRLVKDAFLWKQLSSAAQKKAQLFTKEKFCSRLYTIFS